MLTIYKASAGSGKTFRLVLEYLSLLIKNPHIYRRILAVTFTNKATAGMKNRILGQLHLLATGQKSGYLPLLTENLKISEKTIREKSKDALENILHDYHRFSILTIDTFTQRIIRAFNRELGISPSFTLEIEDDMILSEAIDRLLASIGDNKNLLHWLVDFSEEKISDNQSQKIEKDIAKLGNELFREKFQLFFPQNHQSVYTRENLDILRNELNQIITSFRHELKSKASKALEHIHKAGFTPDDFLHKSGGIAGYLTNMSKEIIREPGARVTAAHDDPEKWVNRSHKKREEIIRLTEKDLLPLLHEITGFYQSHVKGYNSAVAVNAQLRTLGILTDLKEEVRSLLHEKGALQLSDANLLLNKIIGETDSPFIYERTGNQFNHFMLDEFQDTSTMQWMNFKPLIANSLAEGQKNLVVGDVKQSIYRWRNSDWNILATQLDYDFPGYPQRTEILSENWRSDKHIIEFNNAVIKNLTETTGNLLFPSGNSEKWEKERQKFLKIYEDTHQYQGKSDSKSEGWVKISFLEDENFMAKSAEKLVEEVIFLQDQGLKPSEIAILIRRNSEGQVIIQEFLKAAAKKENTHRNLSVLSNESLFLGSSKAVRFVIHVIELFMDPENVLTRVALLNLWNSGLKEDDNPNNVSWTLDINFNNQFQQELESRITILKQKTFLSSPDETITQICAEFNLFALTNELPYLQTLIDCSAGLKLSTINDLSNLLLWWEEKGDQISVSVNDDADSVRLLTVHKSKGLEFKAVLIPFFDWNTTWAGTQAPVLWCLPDKKPFNRFPLLPVKANEILNNSWFCNEFIEEKASAVTDTMNLIYVAFTRAKSILIIHAKDHEKKEKNTPPKNANGLLKEALQKMTGTPTFSNCWNENLKTFEFGQPESWVSDLIASPDQILIDNYNYQPFQHKIKLKTDRENYLPAETGERSIKDTGKITHEILSYIHKKSDLEKACLKPFFEGKISEKELSDIWTGLKVMLENPEISHWFDGSWKVLNERSLLSSSHVLRPDRIMISGSQAVVVDYKTGMIKSENHIRQVNMYADTLKKAGYKKVEGFIWYIRLNEIIKAGQWINPFTVHDDHPLS